MISPISTCMGLATKKIDYFQCVTGQVDIVFRKTPSQSFASKEPTKALKVPDFTTYILKLQAKPSLSKEF